jgi:hypothetical protein
MDAREQAVELFEKYVVQHSLGGYALPTRGYCISSRGGKYEGCFREKHVAYKGAQLLANATGRTVDIIKVQNGGEDRFIVEQVEPASRVRGNARPKYREGQELYLTRSISGIPEVGTGDLATVIESYSARGESTRYYVRSRGQKFYVYEDDLSKRDPLEGAHGNPSSDLEWKEDSSGYVVYTNRKTGAKVKVWGERLAGIAFVCRDWHTGQGSGCYAMASSGDYSPETLENALHELREADQNTSAPELYEPLEDLERITDELAAIS